MVEYICKYCDNKFSAKSNLNRHQKRAKYCLDLQGKSPEVLTQPKKRILCTCGKSFTRQDNLARHQRKCTFEPEIVPEPSPETDALVQVMNKVLDTLKEVAGKPTTTVNTHNGDNINLQPITNNYLVTESNKHLTEQIVMEGRQPEVAIKIFDGYVTIADKARKKIRYKDEEGNVSTNSRKLIQDFYRAIQGKNEELANKLYKEIRASVNEFIAEGRVGESDFTKLLTSGTDLQDRLIAIKNVADGVIDDHSSKLSDETLKCILTT